MHTHNSCTSNGDHFNRLINTSNAHKKRMLPQTTIISYKKREMGGTKAQSELMAAAT